MPASSGFQPLSVVAEDLACARGGRLVFAGLSFRLAPGTLTAIIGPNGAGKSSLLRMIAGLLQPHAGTLVMERLDGSDAAAAHYLGHVDALKPAETLIQTLRFWAALTGGGRGEDELAGAADAVGLRHVLHLPVQVLSAGQRRRAGLARLLIAPRRLWLLDEPTSALDRAGVDLLGALMRSHLAQGGVIAAATHGDLPTRPDATLDLAALE